MEWGRWCDVNAGNQGLTSLSEAPLDPTFSDNYDKFLAKIQVRLFVPSNNTKLEILQVELLSAATSSGNCLRPRPLTIHIRSCDLAVAGSRLDSFRKL
jgi:hypothetical protein